jgi:hypothetical protein
MKMKALHMNRNRVLMIMLTLGIACGATASRAQLPLGGPMMGVLYDSEKHALVPVPGIPGASSLAANIELDPRLQGVSISPSGDYGLAVDEEARLVLMRLDGHTPIIDGLQLDPSDIRIVFSPTGTSALIHLRNEKEICVLSGLPQQPRLVWRQAQDLPFAPGQLAVSDSGAAVLFGTPVEESAALFVITAGNWPEVIVQQSPAAIEFVPKRDDAVFADASTRQLVLVESVTSARHLRVIADERDGIVDPVAIASSQDGSRVFAVNKSSEQILVVNIAGGSITTVSCTCSPTGLYRLQGNAVFRLTELSGKGIPLWVLDANSPEPRTVFIPAPTQ